MGVPNSTARACGSLMAEERKLEARSSVRPLIFNLSPLITAFN